MSTLLWQIEKVKELRELRKKQNKCERCGFYYFKTLEKCPHCSDLPDYKIKLLIKKRLKERKKIGKYMLLAMSIIMLALYLSLT